MSKSQSFLWERILELNREIGQTKDALAKWEKQILLKVLIMQLKEDMGEAAYRNLLDSSRKMFAH